MSTTTDAPQTIRAHGGLYALAVHPDDPIHLQVVLPYHLHSSLKDLAKARGTTMKALITDQVESLVTP